MKSRIRGTVYDPDEAERIAQFTPQPTRRETLYKTPGCEYFLLSEDWDALGDLVDADTGPRLTWLTPQSPEQALAWCKSYPVDNETIRQEFSHLIEEHE